MAKATRKKAGSKKSGAKKSSTKKSSSKKSSAKKTTKKGAKKTKGKSGKKTTSKQKATKKHPGLYANIHKAQERAKHGGRPVRKKGSAGAPTDKSFRQSEKTAKK